MTQERFLEIVLAYAQYTLQTEGIPSLNNEEFLRKLRFTLRQPVFAEIRATEEEAIETIQRLSKRILGGK